VVEYPRLRAAPTVTNPKCFRPAEREPASSAPRGVGVFTATTDSPLGPADPLMGFPGARPCREVAGNGVTRDSVPSWDFLHRYELAQSAQPLLRRYTSSVRPVPARPECSTTAKALRFRDTTRTVLRELPALSLGWSLGRLSVGGQARPRKDQARARTPTLHAPRIVFFAVDPETSGLGFAIRRKTIHPNTK